MKMGWSASVTAAVVRASRSRVAEVAVGTLLATSSQTDPASRTLNLGNLGVVVWEADYCSLHLLRSVSSHDQYAANMFCDVYDAALLVRRYRYTWTAMQLPCTRRSRNRPLHVPMQWKGDIPPSNDTSSISDVTDIRCAVRSGDLEGAALLLGSSAVALTFFGRLGTSGTGESALLSWAVEDEEPGLLMSDRDDRERSECESGRGVTSEASSKLSYTSTRDQHVLHGSLAVRALLEFTHPIPIRTL